MSELWLYYKVIVENEEFLSWGGFYLAPSEEKGFLHVENSVFISYLSEVLGWTSVIIQQISRYEYFIEYWYSSGNWYQVLN